MATEQRLIDVCAEIRKIEDVLTERKEQAGSFTYKVFEAVKTALEKAPTVDARPVVHGRWEECDWVKFDGHSECIHHPRAAWCCSNCRNAFKKELLWKDNYCPNCGADMRGSDNG